MRHTRGQSDEELCSWVCVVAQAAVRLFIRSFILLFLRSFILFACLLVCFVFCLFVRKPEKIWCNEKGIVFPIHPPNLFGGVEKRFMCAQVSVPSAAHQ